MRAILLSLMLTLVSSCQGNTEFDRFAAIGQVGISDKSGCSGVLVTTEWVLTAGHCVANRQTWQAHLPGSVTFRTVDGVYPVVEIVLSSEAPFDDEGHIERLEHDWAYLRLAVKPDFLPIPMADANLAKLNFILDELIIKAGFDTKGSFSIDENCQSLEGLNTSRAFRFLCGDSSGGGRSGSAMLLRIGQADTVVAIQSAIQTLDDTREIGIAVVPQRGPPKGH